MKGAKYRISVDEFFAAFCSLLFCRGKKYACKSMAGALNLSGGSSSYLVICITLFRLGSFLEPSICRAFLFVSIKL